LKTLRNWNKNIKVLVLILVLY